MMQQNTAREKPEVMILLLSIVGLLLPGKAAELTVLYDLHFGYSQYLLLFICIAMFAGATAGLIVPRTIKYWRVLLLWLPGALISTLFICYSVTCKTPLLSVWQFHAFNPLLLALSGTLATSIAARARREKRYAHLLSLPIIALLLGAAALLFEAY